MYLYVLNLEKVYKSLENVEEIVSPNFHKEDNHCLEPGHWPGSKQWLSSLFYLEILTLFVGQVD